MAGKQNVICCFTTSLTRRGAVALASPVSNVCLDVSAESRVFPHESNCFTLERRTGMRLRMCFDII